MSLATALKRVSSLVLSASYCWWAMSATGLIIYSLLATSASSYEPAESSHITVYSKCSLCLWILYWRNTEMF